MHYFAMVLKRVGSSDFGIITMSHTTNEQEHIDQMENYRKYYNNHQEYFLREFCEV